jgi:hypothetical protein
VPRRVWRAQNGRQNVTYGDQVYPINAMAALANNDPDYPGSCGRCYELRCRSLPVIANGTTPYHLSGLYQLAAVAPTALDEHGRTCAAPRQGFPGLVGGSKGLERACAACPAALMQRTGWCSMCRMRDWRGWQGARHRARASAEAYRCARQKHTPEAAERASEPGTATVRQRGRARACAAQIDG